MAGVGGQHCGMQGRHEEDGLEGDQDQAARPGPQIRPGGLTRHSPKAPRAETPGVFSFLGISLAQFRHSAERSGRSTVGSRFPKYRHTGQRVANAAIGMFSQWFSGNQELSRFLPTFRQQRLMTFQKHGSCVSSDADYQQHQPRRTNDGQHKRTF